jgi:Tol biopolymer transport system component
MKTTPKLFPFLISSLLVLIIACNISGTGASPTMTPYIITATMQPTSETDIFLTQTAAVTPTIEPVAHSLPANLRLVYTDTSGNLFHWTQAASASSLLSSGDIIGARLSDDGQWVAFTRSTDYIHFSLWAIGFDGSGERELVSSDTLMTLKNNADAIGVEPYIFSWVPNSHTLAFNTSPKFDGPGLMINNDLQLVDVETSALTTMLSAGNGGVFYYSPDGTQIALVTPENISLINADGSNRRSNVLVYDPVLTYSEFQYYAEPQWSADGTFLRVAIPPQDSLGDPTQQTTLWHIPTDGTAAGVAGHILTAPLSTVTLSPDLSWIAYEDYFSDASDPMRNLHINTITGSSDHIYTTGQINLNTWAPDSIHFIYTEPSAGVSKYANKDDGEVLLLPAGSVISAHFADEFSYIYLRNTGTDWEIAYGTLDGTQTTIASMPKPGGGRVPGYSFVN